ncbi:MAG: phospholipase D-like domain-containing protein [Micropruina sp.]|uniref:phospholipase D-like domain-containing protein n=1 Tax=Micropruina sp. TaxID=2737536 RepID=UPI0039E2CFB2
MVVSIIDLAIKAVAVATIPHNRRPSSSVAWLLLIIITPLLGLVIFFVIGSPFVRGRRYAVQERADRAITSRAVSLPDVPDGADLPDGLDSVVRLNRQLTSMPMLGGTSHGLFGDYTASLAAMTAAVRAAQHRVHLEMYILARDAATEEFFEAMADAVRRGVVVRVLYDHIGSRKYPGFKQMNQTMTRDGIQWHQMMPIKPLQGRWRRPDLRNHRKLLVVDSRVAFMGSQNLIDSSYLMPANLRIGRHWLDLNIQLSGPIISSLEAVFALDWMSETGESLADEVAQPEVDEGDQPLQLVPSGPGYRTMPNLRLFTALIHRAQHRLSITSPYFVPEESLLEAVTTAAYRGVEVELFVSEGADQFVVQHAQASYYQGLLEAGVRIYLYPKPTVLHAKFFTVDDVAGVIGSSNMDYRSFGLDYEISLLGTAPEFVADLQRIADGYRRVCRELTAEEWSARSPGLRYVENVTRLMAALQ